MRAALLMVIPFALAGCASGKSAAPGSPEPANVLTGKAALVSTTSPEPGTFRKVTVEDLPAPYATKSVSTISRIVPRPEGVLPQAPPGFAVHLYATGLEQPRVIQVAPNGDVFVMETRAGRIRVLRGVDSAGRAAQSSVFATGFVEAYGMAFYPRDDPRWLYVANTNSVVRLPYEKGDLVASGAADTVIASLPSDVPRDIDAFAQYVRSVRAGQLPPDHGHWTRDIAFSLDGSRLFVAVGSASNVDDPDEHPSERLRADILEYTPDGKFVKVFASGLRNPSGIAVDPNTGELWTSVNERDGLGDDLVPDYITHVEDGGFYGWPYFYLGAHPDPRHEGKHPELVDKVIVPDVLLQSHSASLQITFYRGTQFPAEYRGDIFASQHGSWNRSVRSGYEVVRVPLRDGKASGVYEDFLTGFLTPDGDVWGRPVGVGVASDGSLLVSDDGSGSVWRVVYKGF
ncbi:MAG TPA: PQQ-dependent sugar dehydrogenase [Gemmatimonadaceae bacterium]|nr:PQQ-dependent sugar dehydrogenase [Gemmatimonadaceae bacterium]